MIISIRRYTYEELKGMLSKDEKIILFTCNTCIKFCDVGGRVRTHQLAEKLTEDGYNVIREENVGAACLLDLIEKRKTDEATRKTFEEADTIIVLTCEDGWDNVAYTFPDKKVLKVTKTLGLGLWRADKGPVLTCPLGFTGLERDYNGYVIAEYAEKLGGHAGPYYDPEAQN